MQRITILFAAATLATVPVAQTLAHNAPHGTGTHKETTSARTTITGEVVDTGCYLGHAARGEKHMSCAAKCINQGMPMGLVTKDGTLYLVTLNHDNADPYNSLKTMPGKMVSVTGTVMSRAGMKAIDVTDVKPVTKAAGK